MIILEKTSRRKCIFGFRQFIIQEKKKMYDRRYVCDIMGLFLCLFLTACGEQADVEADTKNMVGIKTEIQLEIPSEAMPEELAETAGNAEDEGSEPENAEEENVTIVYTTEGIQYSDEAIPIIYTDDFSLLGQIGQTDCGYAYQDGKVYYRQYHTDSFEEGAVLANYQPTVGSDKEIVCVDSDGKKAVMFSDKGYGNFYLVGDRFYMTEKIAKRQDGMECIYSAIYSVDMQGQNREDYGYGEICVVDTDRNIIVLRTFSEVTGEGAFCILNCISGEMTPLTYDPNGVLTFWDYRDGWCYFDAHWETDICRVVAMSVESRQKTIITLKSDKSSEEYGYREEICRMSVDDDRIYIVFGGYAGSGGYFQGGRIITAKLDGSDYQAVECRADCYYVCYDTGSPRLYFLDYFFESGEAGKTNVWDVEADTVFLSDFPPELIYEQQAQNVLVHRAANSQFLCELHTNIYALPDDSARIVEIAKQIDRDVERSGDLEWNWDYHRGDVSYQHLYYADGYLYFDAVFNRYDDEYTIGWREGYRRVQTNVYRLRLADGSMELLYSY